MIVHDSDNPVPDDQVAVLPGDTRPDDIPATLLTSAVITIEFGNFADGRGLSLARYLRQAHGYTGRLQATGNLLPDQLQELLSAGFDRVLHVIGREADWEKAENPFVGSGYVYQSNATAGASIWQQRHAGND